MKSQKLRVKAQSGNLKLKAFTLCAFLLHFALCTLHFPSPALAVFNEAAPSPSYLPNQIIVKYKESQSPPQLQTAVNQRARRAQSFFGQIQNKWEDFSLRLQDQESPEDKLQRILETNQEAGVLASESIFQNPNLSSFFLYKTNGQKSVEEMIGEYQALPEVESVEPDFIMTMQEAPNDPYYPQMWNLPKIQMEAAWEQTKGSEQIIVAVVDTGVDSDHPDLRDHLAPGFNFVNNSDNPEDDLGHGTHVAGTIGALTNNAKGVAGLNWQVKIMPVKVLNSGGSGPASQVAKGIEYAYEHGAKVINLSLGGPQPCSQNSPHQVAINQARTAGSVVVVSAGNSGANARNFSPASCAGVITVAATTPSDQRASFSNYGSVVDLAAPGVNILSTLPPGAVLRSCGDSDSDGYDICSGTSMASPHVAGAAALLLAKNPSLTPDQVESFLKENTDTLTSSRPIGTGRLNVNKALAALSGEGTPPVSPTGTAPTTTPTITPLPTVTPGGPTTTPIPTVTPPTTPPLHPCPTQALAGDYNCDGKVDGKDYSNQEGEKKGWLEDFLAGKSTLSFFEYWRRAFFTGEVEPTATPTPAATLPEELVSVLNFAHTEPTWDDNDMRIYTRIKSQDPWRIASYTYIQPQTDKDGILVPTTSGSIRCEGAGNVPGIGNCDSNGTLDTNPGPNILYDHVHAGAGATPVQVFEPNQGYIIEVVIKNINEDQTYQVYFGAERMSKQSREEALENPFQFQ